MATAGTAARIQRAAGSVDGSRAELVRNSGGEAAKIAALHATEAAHADVDVLGPKSAREAATGLLVSHVGEGEMTDRARAQAAFVKVAAKVLGTSEWRDGS